MYDIHKYMDNIHIFFIQTVHTAICMDEFDIFQKKIYTNFLDTFILLNILAAARYKKKLLHLQELLPCGRRDLNPHERNAHKNLNLARLPIPTLPQTV